MINNYLAFINNAFNTLIPIICKHDRPLGWRINLYTRLDNSPISDSYGFLDHAGNLIYLQVDHLLKNADMGNISNENVEDVYKVILDTLLTIIHELFHVNQLIDYSKYNLDKEYTRIIEGSNTYMADKFFCDNAEFLNTLIYGNKSIGTIFKRPLNTRYANIERGVFEDYAQYYREKTIEESLAQKLRLINFKENFIQKVLQAKNFRMKFSNKDLVIKSNGNYDLNSICQLNKFVYRIFNESKLVYSGELFSNLRICYDANYTVFTDDIVCRLSDIEWNDHPEYLSKGEFI